MTSETVGCTKGALVLYVFASNWLIGGTVNSSQRITWSGSDTRWCSAEDLHSVHCFEGAALKADGGFFCLQALGELRVTFPDPPDVRSSPSAAKGRWPALCSTRRVRFRSGLSQHV